MKNLYTFLFSILCFFPLLWKVAEGEATAQTPSWQWAHGGGSTGNEWATGTAVDGNGNAYFIGWYGSAGITLANNTLINAGASDIFIAKYDAAGNPFWAKSIGGAEGDLGSSITADVNGNIYFTGWYASATISLDNITLNNAGTNTSDIFIAKYDANGNALWAKSIGGTDAERGLSICTDAAGNVYVTGTFNSSSVSFGTHTVANATAGSSDVFIVKYDASGNALWAKSAGGTGSDKGNGIAADASGNVFITGSFTSAAITFGSTVLVNSGNGTQDIFLAKYDASGNALWAIRSGGTDEDYSSSICTDTNGNVFFTGTFSSASAAFGSITLSNSSAGMGDFFIAAYDASGNNLWAEKAGGVDGEGGNGIAADATGGLYVTGWFNGSSVSFGTHMLNNSNPGYNDLFVTKYNAVSGNALWAKGAGDVFDDAGTGITTDAAGSNVYISGMFNSPSIAFGSSVIPKGCSDDIVMAKLDAGTVGIWEYNYFSALNVFPNPSSGIFTIHNLEQNSVIEIYNAQGKKVYSCSSPHVNVSFLSKGVYFLRSRNNHSYGSKIVIE